MRVQKRFVIGLSGVVLLAIVGTGAFFGARSGGDGGPAEANSAATDLSGSAQVSAGANPASADPFVNQYAGEFLCGDMSTLAPFGLTAPLGPGVYNTEIGIHNANSVPVVYIQKKVVPMPLALPEQEGLPTQRRYMALHPDSAFQIDCSDIMSFFPPAGGTSCNGGPVPQPPNAFCKGYVVVEAGKPIGALANIIVPAPLDMTITITVTDPTPPPGTNGFRSLEFELQPGRVVNYPCWSPGTPPFPPPPCP